MESSQTSSTRKTNTTTLIIATLLALISIAVFHLFWLPKGIILSFDYKVHHPIVFEILYTTKSNDKWDGLNNAVRKRVKQNEAHIEFFLPVSHLERLRIDPGSKANHVVLRNMTLTGDKVIELTKDKEAFRGVNIPTLNIRDNEIRLASMHHDPILVYNKPLNIGSNGAREFNLFNFLLVLLTPFCLTFVLRDMWKERAGENELLKAKAPRLANIEFLRILFTLGVVITHIRVCVYKQPSVGAQGVEFFFLLSGYLLAYTFRPNRRLIDLAKRNWIRFVPLIVVGAILGDGGWNSFYGLFMLQNTGLAFQDVPGNGPAWYIGVLFWCTLFYAALLKAIPEKQQGFIIATISFAACVMLAQVHGDRWEMVASYFPRGLVRGIACMGLGIILKQLCVRDAKAPSHQNNGERIIYTILESVLIIYIIISFFTKEFFIDYWIFKPITHIILLASFICKKGIISQLCEHPIFSHCSKYCLGIYLTHWALYRHRFWQVEDIETSTCIAIGVSIILGILAYYLVEKPGIKYLSILTSKKG